MAIGLARGIDAELARLDLAAEGAGSALACVHQTAEEFHRASIRKYLALRARWRMLACCLPLIALTGLFLLA